VGENEAAILEITQRREPAMLASVQQAESAAFSHIDQITIRDAPLPYVMHVAPIPIVIGVLLVKPSE
jgi:hypothetical protein